jgi:hypothetical protein
MHSGLGVTAIPFMDPRWRSTDVTPATDLRSGGEEGTVGTSMT